MKRFVITILSTCLIVSMLTVLINITYLKLDQTDDDYIKKFDAMPEEIVVCNFGSSHGLYGFCYDDVENSSHCFNYALPSQVLSYDRRILECYKNRINKDAVVFITVSYFSFFGKKEEFETTFESKNKRYYKILPSNLIKQYDSNYDMFASKLESLTAYEKIFSVFLGGGGNQNETLWNHTADQIDVSRDADKASERHIIENKFDEQGNRIRNKEEIDAIYEMIHICKELEIYPVLVTTPFMKEYIDAVQKKDVHFFSEFYQVLDEIIKEEDVIYYDYGRDESFINNYKYFMNSDHLNKDGAKFFTKILMEKYQRDKANET